MCIMGWWVGSMPKILIDTSTRMFDADVYNGMGG